MAGNRPETREFGRQAPLSRETKSELSESRDEAGRIPPPRLRSISQAIWTKTMEVLGRGSTSDTNSRNISPAAPSNGSTQNAETLVNVEPKKPLSPPTITNTGDGSQSKIDLAALANEWDQITEESDALQFPLKPSGTNVTSDSEEPQSFAQNKIISDLDIPETDSKLENKDAGISAAPDERGTTVDSVMTVLSKMGSGDTNSWSVLDDDQNPWNAEFIAAIATEHRNATGGFPTVEIMEAEDNSGDFNDDWGELNIEDPDSETEDETPPADETSASGSRESNRSLPSNIMRRVAIAIGAIAVSAAGIGLWFNKNTSSNHNPDEIAQRNPDKAKDSNPTPSNPQEEENTANEDTQEKKAQDESGIIDHSKESKPKIYYPNIDFKNPDEVKSTFDEFYNELNTWEQECIEKGICEFDEENNKWILHIDSTEKEEAIKPIAKKGEEFAQRAEEIAQRLEIALGIECEDKGTRRAICVPKPESDEWKSWDVPTWRGLGRKNHVRPDGSFEDYVGSSMGNVQKELWRSNLLVAEIRYRVVVNEFAEKTNRRGKTPKPTADQEQWIEALAHLRGAFTLIDTVLKRGKKYAVDRMKAEKND